jgi:hypothetical protein
VVLQFHTQVTTQIWELKDLVYQNTRIPRNTIELNFKDQFLEDDKSLADRGIRDGDLLGMHGHLSATLFPSKLYLLPVETIFENHIRSVRFGAHQVWGHMMGGDKTVYEHTTCFKRAAHKVFGHVPSIHADHEVEVVLEIDHVFKKASLIHWTLHRLI